VDEPQRLNTGWLLITKQVPDVIAYGISATFGRTLRYYATPGTGYSTAGWIVTPPDHKYSYFT